MVEGNDELSVINETDLKVIKENKLMENDPRLKKIFFGIIFKE